MDTPGMIGTTLGPAKTVAVVAVLCALVFSGYAFAAGEGGDWIVAKQRQETGYDLSSYLPDKDLKFTFETDTFTLDVPSLRRENDIWVPVEALLKKMRLTFLRVNDSRFGLIRDDGMPLEVSIGSKEVNYRTSAFMTLNDVPSLKDGVAMLSAESLTKILDISYIYSVSSNTIVFSRKKVEEFSTFTVPKPKDLESEKKVMIEPRILPHEPTDIREEFLPPSLARDVDLKLDSTVSYFHDETLSDRTRLTEFYLTGKAYDFTVDGHLRMKDFRSAQKQRFMEDGEFLGLYRKDIWIKLLDNYLTIPSLRSQSQAYFGGEVTTFHGQFKNTVIYGKTDNTVTGPPAIGAIRFYGDLVTLRNTYTSPSNFLITQNYLIVHENHAELTGKSGWVTYPRRALVLITENTVNPYKGLKFNYSHGYSVYRPDNRVNYSLTGQDWKTAAEFTQDRYAFKAAFERVGDQYASIGVPSTYQDYEGWDFSTNYKLAKNFYVNIGSNLSQNNVESDPRRQTNYNKSLTTTSTLVLPWDQSASLGYSVNETIQKGGDVDSTGSRYQDVRLDYVKGFGNMSMQMSYDHYTLESFYTAPGGSETDNFSMSFFNVYPKLNSSYIRIYQAYRKTKQFVAGTYTTEFYDTSLAGRLNIMKYLSVSSDWKVTFTRRENFTDTALMMWTIGGEYSAGPNTTFNVDFALTDWDLYQPKSWLPKHYTILFKGRHVFDIATAEKWGKVDALIFRDLNSNGVRDKDEPPVEKVRVYVVNGRAATTGANGHAVIAKVVPGNRQVKVDLTRMPIDLSVRGAAVKPIKVEPFKTASAEFPVVKTGVIRGRVFIDNDGNGKFEKFVDAGLPNVRVYLTLEERDTLTFSDGTFTFDYTYPGSYSVCLDRRSISNEYKLTSQEKIPVRLEEGGKISNIDFIVAPKRVEMQFVGE